MPLTFIQNSTGTFRLENSDGTQWLVVGGVPAREQVMNNYLVPGPEIVKSLPSWNGVPITIRHPKTNGGSIKTPKPDVPIIGKFKGPTWDQAKKRMTGEYWIDLEAARLSPDGQILVNKIMAGHPVETSTAYFSKDVYIAGTHAGRNYAYINRELKPDHIAILPDEVGACSLKDGCGLNVNAAKKNCSSCPALNGGAGSGNFGHEGIPGHQGGSEPNGGNEIVGRYRINNGKATVTIVNAGANLTPETINAIRSAEDGTVRVIYNTSTNHWHIPDQGLMEVDHGNFIVEALEGYTPAYTEMIEVRGIYDINSNEITLYDFQGIADGIAAENGVNERVVSHQVGKAMDEAEHKYFYLNGKKPTVTVIPFEEVAGFSTNGGEGSGNFGHEGIPGHQGGSEPNGGAMESAHVVADHLIKQFTGGSDYQKAELLYGKWSAAVRDWGVWENPPDAYYEQDYDHQVLKAEWHAKAGKIIEAEAARHPGLDFSYNTGEKNWLEIWVSPKITANGGTGSGNFGHAGIPGHQGGSEPGTSHGMTPADYPTKQSPHYLLQKHSKWSQSDYNYFKSKGYTDAEILDKWDAEVGAGDTSPVTHPDWSSQPDIQDYTRQPTPAEIEAHQVARTSDGKRSMHRGNYEAMKAVLTKAKSGHAFNEADAKNTLTKSGYSLRDVRDFWEIYNDQEVYKINKGGLSTKKNTARIFINLNHSTQTKKEQKMALKLPDLLSALNKLGLKIKVNEAASTEEEPTFEIVEQPEGTHQNALTNEETATLKALAAALSGKDAVANLGLALNSVSKLPDVIKVVEGLQAGDTAKKATLVASLKANKRNTFTDAELGTMEIPQLEKLNAALTVDFRALGGNNSIQTNSEDKPLEMPSVLLAQPAAPEKK